MYSTLQQFLIFPTITSIWNGLISKDNKTPIFGIRCFSIGYWFQYLIGKTAENIISTPCEKEKDWAFVCSLLKTREERHILFLSHYHFKRAVYDFIIIIYLHIKSSIILCLISVCIFNKRRVTRELTKKD